MKLEDLPPLREAVAEHGLAARKGLGQHFLFDLNVTRKIARLAGDLSGETVVEVGPGPGGLTRALLEAGARVTAIEKDARFLPLLAELAEAADGALTVLHADALTAEAPPGAPIVANLPYNVGTPLLVKWLTAPVMPRLMVLMFQKEVALRIAARPATSDYGRLSVLAQAMSEAELAMHIPARAFTPPPKVDSAVVRLTPRRDAPEPALRQALERVTAAAFGQRRKMLRASLRPLGGEALCRAADVEPSLRAEALDLSAFLRLARAL
jgi:16S rRNA (adenine1518-N6/adenine1519-N6)-dimethyltransferase